MMAGVSPFAAAYAQPKSIGNGPQYGDPFALEDPRWGTGGLPPDPFAPTPEVAIADPRAATGRATPAQPGTVRGGGDTRVTGTPIGGGGIVPDLNYVPAWMQQFIDPGGFTGTTNTPFVPGGTPGAVTG